MYFRLLIYDLLVCDYLLLRHDVACAGSECLDRVCCQGVAFWLILLGLNDLFCFCVDCIVFWG